MRRRKALSYLLETGNNRIKRYSRADLGLITSGNGGNAYQSAEEWVTDIEATQQSQDGNKVQKLVCIEKWWRGENVSI